MDITINEQTIRVIIMKITGRIDAFSTPALREQQDKLIKDGANSFIVDLHEVGFLDSAGMAALVSLLKQARQANGDVVLIWPVEIAAKRTITLTKFDRVFIMANDIKEALKSFSF